MSTDKKRLDMVNEYRAELKAVHGVNTREMTAEDYIADVWELVEQLEEAHQLLELAEELISLRDEGEELQARLKQRQEEYDTQRQQVTERAAYSLYSCGPYPWYRPVDDPTEGDPPPVTSASELRARLQRAQERDRLRRAGELA